MADVKPRIIPLCWRRLLNLVAVLLTLLLCSWVIAWFQVVPLVHTRTTVPLVFISQPIQDATVAMEDGYFYQHHGFDGVAIQRALGVDWQKKRIVQGGSTLTQQLAKNLFLTKDRTLWRKAEEVPLTLEMERTLSKKRILELYLNSIDYGCGQRGISSAASFYFHTTAAQLTLSQSAILVGLVPHPPPTLHDLRPDELDEGRDTALERVAYFFPKRYPQTALSRARDIPINQLVYPYKDAWDRGATDSIPPDWHGVNFYFYAEPNEPTPVLQVSASLKPAMGRFLDEARHRYGLTGLDHLGVYNDRSMRQSQTVPSAHAYGQAIDISGFRFADGSHVLVKDHSNPKIAVRLNQLEALLRTHFPVVVDWRDDPLRHQTHFHCEVHGPRPIAPRPPAPAQEYSVKEAIHVEKAHQN